MCNAIARRISRYVELTVPFVGEQGQERLRERLEKLLGFLEESLKGKDYILGEQFTAADIFLSGPLTILAVRLTTSTVQYL